MSESRTQFDSVLDENLGVLYNGTPDQVQVWLRDNSWAIQLRVSIGKTTQIVSAKDYVRL